MGGRWRAPAGTVALAIGVACAAGWPTAAPARRPAASASSRARPHSGAGACRSSLRAGHLRFVRCHRARGTVGARVSLPAYVPDPGAPASDPTGCNPLGGGECLYPFPSDYSTRADPTSATGRRVDLRLGGMPRNGEGLAISDTADYDTLDGFSPGEPIELKVPGLDNEAALERSGTAPITDVGRSRAPDAPVVVIDTRTLARQLVWTEVDANASSDAERALIIRPAAAFREGDRYIVALRGLRDARGALLQPGAAFRALRDGTPSTDPFVLRERAHYASLFAYLAAAGVPRANLDLAWDFTVGSSGSIAGRLLHIRDDAFAQLGDHNLADGVVAGRSPSFAVTQVQDFTPSQNAAIARQVDGFYTVPCYLDTPGCAGVHSQFQLGPDGLPRQLGAGTPLANTMQVPFECRIPRAALDGPPAHASLYGHGLFGTYTEVADEWVDAFAAEHDFAFCATYWAGMSQPDIPNLGTVLLDLSNFPTLVDRLQQGILNFMYLGRLMVHPGGFASSPAFALAGRPLIDGSQLYYDGNSQGGIEGGALAAVDPDFTRAVLGVPGMDFSLLITRSSDFGNGTQPTSYAFPLYTSYPDELARPLLLALVQMLWDRGEPDGLAEHMTDSPYPNTPAHEVLLQEAFGDFQVSNWATEMEARTVGAHLVYPPARMLAPGRSPEVQPFIGIPPFASLPGRGSALTVWDGGTEPPPAANVPPSAGSAPAQQDPHQYPRDDAAERAQAAAFLLSGRVVDVCGGGPCYDHGYPGPG